MTTERVEDRLPDWLSGDPWERDVRKLLARMNRRVETVIVEGPNDRAALRTAGVDARIRTCSQTDGLVDFAASLEGAPIAILTDYDDPGRRLNGRLRHLLPDGRVDPCWRRDLGLLLTQRGRYDIESLNNVFRARHPHDR